MSDNALGENLLEHTSMTLRNLSYTRALQSPLAKLSPSLFLLKMIYLNPE